VPDTDDNVYSATTHQLLVQRSTHTRSATPDGYTAR